MPALNVHSATKGLLLTLFLVPSFLISAVAAPAKVHGISKCQDADGKWHYGDNAASACGDTRITIIDKRGRKVDELAPPMTVDEINAQKAEEERIKAEEEEIVKRELEKKRILTIYPREESIIRARDERLSGMDKNIRLQEELLDNMRLDMKELDERPVPENDKEKQKLESRKKIQQENIDEYYQAITRLRRERQQTAEKFERILTEFRELTTQ